MKKLVVLMFCALSVSMTQAREYQYETVPNDPMEARIYTLDNGLKVYLTRNAEKPVIQTYIAVRAGSENDPLESTGLAHYQEHIMFKGTSQFGTTDYAAEKPNLDAIDSLYEVYGMTTDSAARAAIYHQIDSFSYEGSKIAIANEFDKLMEAIGATGINAYTSTSRTCYHEIIPAGELRRWAMIESARFKDLVVRGFHTELEAVYEEFNMYSTNDSWKVRQAIDNILFPDVPYRQHTVLGTPEHLKNPNLKNIKKFYRTFYRPNNCAIMMSGDLDFDHTMAIIEEYFGSWESNPDIPAFVVPEQKPLTARRDSVVEGQESPQVWMGWRFPEVTHNDIDAIEVMAEVLYNGYCGLIDLDLTQQQKLLGAAAFPYEGNDFTTFYLVGVPQQGQNLQQTADLLLAEVEKLKRGEFSEQILQAIINNMRRSEMESLQDNEDRVSNFLESFINGIPYEDIVNNLERKSKVTKADIVRVANLYFTDGFACVYKEQGEGKNVATVNKPHITPIEMNRDKQSAFCTNLLAMQTERLQPQFLDFDKDLTKKTLSKGQELLYKQNTENDLFNLEFVIDKGTQQDPVLQLVADYMSYLGSKKVPAEMRQMMQYALATDMYVDVDDEQTTIGLYGLQENFLQMLPLLEEWIMRSLPNNAIYAQLCQDMIKSHEDAKSNQRACFSRLRAFGTYGDDAIKAQTLTPAQLQKMSGKDVLNHLRALLPQIARVTYYGPADCQSLEQMLSKSVFVKKGNAKSRSEATHSVVQQIGQPEVWIAPFDAPNIYFFALANWGEAYSPKDEAIIRLFNEYFDGSMGSLVFQEMREARALCYACAAGYSTPSHAGDCNTFMQYIITQNNKMEDAISTFAQLCNDMPLSQAAFDKAKQSLLMNIEQRRYVRAAAINAYIGFERKGWDHDHFADIYREAQKLTLEDVVAFQKEHVANRTYRYLILGNEEELNMDFLNKLGEVRRLTKEDIFVY